LVALAIHRKSDIFVCVKYKVLQLKVRESVQSN